MLVLYWVVFITLGIENTEAHCIFLHPPTITKHSCSLQLSEIQYMLTVGNNNTIKGVTFMEMFKQIRGNEDLNYSVK